MWSDGARGAEISAYAGDQTVPVGEKDSESPLRESVRRRRVARRFIQRARRRAFRQEASVKNEERVSQLESQVGLLLEIISVLSSKVQQLVNIFEESVEAADAETNTTSKPGTTQTKTVEAATQTTAYSLDVETYVNFTTLLNSVSTQTSDDRNLDRRPERLGQTPDNQAPTSSQDSKRKQTTPMTSPERSPIRSPVTKKASRSQLKLNLNAPEFIPVQLIPGPYTSAPELAPEFIPDPLLLAMTHSIDSTLQRLQRLEDSDFNYSDSNSSTSTDTLL